MSKKATPIENRLNKGVFSFLANKGLSLQEMRIILHKYALTLELPKPKKNRLEWYVILSDLAQDNFKSFRQYVKDLKITNRQRIYADSSYDDSDFGGYAYNNSADDL